MTDVYGHMKCGMGIKRGVYELETIRAEMQKISLWCDEIHHVRVLQYFYLTIIMYVGEMHNAFLFKLMSVHCENMEKQCQGTVEPF